MKLTAQQFRLYLNKSQDKNEYQRIQVVYLRIIRRKPAYDVSQTLCVPIGTIYQWSWRYNKFGIDGILNKPKGGNHNSLMTKKEELLLLKELEADGIKGCIVTAKEIRLKIETKLTKPTSHTHTYNVLKRHKWRKIAPRPRNPKTKPADRETFKNNFHELVEQKAYAFASGDLRPIVVLFEDEARFGRINNLMRCWAPHGIRPHVDHQVVRQFTYVYATVCPQTGQTVSLILPDADSAMMNLFLDEVKQVYKDYRIILVADQARWHTSDAVNVNNDNNLKFLFLPPASPELNPAEHLWDHVREKYFANQIFDSMTDLEQSLERVFHEIYLDKVTIKSLTSFSWLN